MALVRNQERLKLDNGAVVEVYTTPPGARSRARKFYTCRVTFADGTQTTAGGFAHMTAAWEWGIAQGREGQG
jgi:hypothetical protein